MNGSNFPTHVLSVDNSYQYAILYVLSAPIVFWGARLCLFFVSLASLLTPDARACVPLLGGRGDCTVCHLYFYCSPPTGTFCLVRRGLGGGSLTKGVGRRASLPAVRAASPCLPAA